MKMDSWNRFSLNLVNWKLSLMLTRTFKGHPGDFIWHPWNYPAVQVISSDIHGTTWTKFQFFSSKQMGLFKLAICNRFNYRGVWHTLKIYGAFAHWTVPPNLWPQSMILFNKWSRIGAPSIKCIAVLRTIANLNRVTIRLLNWPVYLSPSYRTVTSRIYSDNEIGVDLGRRRGAPGRLLQLCSCEVNCHYIYDSFQRSETKVQTQL